MAVNNEIGSNPPIEAISELLVDKPTISFHVDAVQALLKFQLKSIWRIEWILPPSRVISSTVLEVSALSISSLARRLHLCWLVVVKRETIVRQLKMLLELQRQPRPPFGYGKVSLFTSKTRQMKAVIRQALLDYPDILSFQMREDFLPLISWLLGLRGSWRSHRSRLWRLWHFHFYNLRLFVQGWKTCRYLGLPWE